MVFKRGWEMAIRGCQLMKLREKHASFAGMCKIVLILIFIIHIHPHFIFTFLVRSMLGVNVLGICSPCQMFLSDSVEESSQDTISCMRGSDCQVVALFVVA